MGVRNGMIGVSVLAMTQAALAQAPTSKPVDGTINSPSPATADSQQVPTTDLQRAAAPDEIVVVGIRGSLKRSVDTKRNALNVVDSIDSEDIGKLPDQNVAESLQRIPGVTIDRNRGEGQFISVRGLGPQFNSVTLNGRTLATSNVGREFSFDILPAELISGADVYKSPTARIPGSSIGATVDIRTVRPLDQKPFVAAGTVEAERQVLDGSWAKSASGLISWRNEDSTFGVAIVGSYENKHVEIQEFRVNAGWGLRSSNSSYFNGRIGPNVAPFTNLYMPFNMTPTYEYDHRRRMGASATVQWKPADNLVMTLDGLYARLKERAIQSQVAYDFGGGTLAEQVVSGNTVQYQKFVNGFVDQIQNDSNYAYSTSLLGYNVNWTTGDFKLIGDASYSLARRKGKEDVYNTTIRRTGMTLEWDKRGGSPIYDMRFSNPTYANAPVDRDHIGAHYMNNGGADYKDTVLNARLDGVWDAGGAVKLYTGYLYENRKKKIDRITQPVASQNAFVGGTIFYPLPSNLFGLTNDDYFPGHDGNTVRQWINWNASELTNTLKGFRGGPPGFVGYQDPVPNPAGSSVVEEKDHVGYIMADVNAELGSMPFSLNAGVRIEDTSFTSSGAAQTIVSARPNGQGQNIIVLSGIVPISFKGHYTDVLPSLNMKLSLTPKLIARFAASRVMTRPTLSDLSPAQTILSNPGNEQITRGNPNLLPFRASQAEFGAEWYLNPYSVLAASVFYKNIDSFVSRATTPQQVDQVTFQVTQPTNGRGATVKGAEIGYRQVFSSLPGLLSGLGAQASLTYVTSNADYANTVTGTRYGLEGLSKYSYSLVGFYEKGPLQARVAYTWRDTFLQQAVGRNGLPLYFDAYGQLDASFSYRLTPNVTLNVNALNLTDEREFSYLLNPDKTFSYRRAGPRYTFGIRANL